MKFILMGLVKRFTKEAGRSPNSVELTNLKKMAQEMESSEKVIPFPMGGKDKVSPFKPRPEPKSKTLEDSMESFFGFKPRPKPETEAEMLERMNRQNKESVARLKKKKEKDLGEKLRDYDGDPDAMAMGGRAGFNLGGLAKLLKMLQGKVGKKNITTADKIARPESALNREMFGAFENRINRKTLDVPSMPSGFQLSREKLLKNFPELDESYADEIMAMDKELQGRVLTMLKDRRKDPDAYDKLLMEKGDTLDFQGEFDRSVRRSKNAAGGLAYMLGEPRDGLEKGGAPSDVVDSGLLDRNFDKLDLDEITDILKSIGVDNKADGGIISLKEGGPPNPGRRNFMKLMAGLASIPVLGKFFKPAAKVAKTVTPLTNTTTAMPAWFPKFVDKVIDKGVGTKIDADIMKYEVKELPGIQVTKHDDGRIYVEGQNDYGKGYDIEYQPPGYEVTDYKTGKAVKTKGDFTAQEEVPVNMDPDGNVDFEGEILEDVDDILTSDSRTMEGFAKGRKISFKEKKYPGESKVGEAEVAAENRADAYRESLGEMDGEDFATGGLAKLLGE